MDAFQQLAWPWPPVTPQKLVLSVLTNCYEWLTIVKAQCQTHSLARSARKVGEEKLTAHAASLEPAQAMHKRLPAPSQKKERPILFECGLKSSANGAIFMITSRHTCGHIHKERPGTSGADSRCTNLLTLPSSSQIRYRVF